MNNINVHTLFYYNTYHIIHHIILYIISIRIIIYYLIKLYSYKKWAINTRNETLLKIIRESDIYSLRHLLICVSHFNNTMYNTSSRFILH